MASKRYIVIERPYYRSAFDLGVKHYLDDDLGDDAPSVGDVVKVTAGPDNEGDFDVKVKGNDTHINRDVVVSVDKLVEVYKASLDKTEAAPGPAVATRQAPKVGGNAPVLTVTAVAKTLLDQTELDGPDIDLAIAFALLRSTGAL